MLSNVQNFALNQNLSQKQFEFQLCFTKSNGTHLLLKYFFIFWGYSCDIGSHQPLPFTGEHGHLVNNNQCLKIDWRKSKRYIVLSGCALETLINERTAFEARHHVPQTFSLNDTKCIEDFENYCREEERYNPLQ